MEDESNVSEPMNDSSEIYAECVPNKKLAKRALVIALLSVGLHIIGYVYLHAAFKEASGQFEVGQPVPVAEFMEGLSRSSRPSMIIAGCGNILGLVGIGFAIFATKRKQWGIALVLAWILNALGACTAPYVGIM